MTDARSGLRRGTARVEEVPITWVAPTSPESPLKLVVWLAPGLSAMGVVAPVLERLASEGYLAVSFDSWGRGSRCREPLEELMPRAWANYPLVAWPLYAQGALEVLRVADWAARTFDVAPRYAVGGNSAGGDIAVAAAGLDPRIACVATTVATPDWRRPGMHVGGELVAPGAPDAYARYLYERIDPLTNLASFAHRPAIAFECGADDDHVPADGAQRFVAALAGRYGEDAASRLRVTLHPGLGHETTPAMMDRCVDWLHEHH
jgi:dienelactone hydrolase